MCLRVPTIRHRCLLRALDVHDALMPGSFPFVTADGGSSHCFTLSDNCTGTARSGELVSRAKTWSGGWTDCWPGIGA